MSSSLLQIRMTNYQLRGFTSPISQPIVNPLNCGAVTGQLLKLVTPTVANNMTILGLGKFVQEWIDHTTGLLPQPTHATDFDIRAFKALFTKMLFPGFGTFVGTYSPLTKEGHFFVVGKFLNGQLVVLDPQLRKGYLNIENYFQENRPLDTHFIVIETKTKNSRTYYDKFSKYLLENVQGACDKKTTPYAMDEDVPPSADVEMNSSSDVEMNLGGRKRRKTKRRSLAKRTLRRVNRRRRIL